MNKIYYAILAFSMVVLLVILGIVMFIIISDKNFSNNSSNNVTPTVKITSTACKVAGCSGQLCVEADADGASTCEYTAEYACYKTANCARQANGKCGWTQTDTLKMCIQNARENPIR